MMNNKLILALSVLFSLPAIGYSQTVSWATPPVYESLEEYTGDLYKIREHGKVVPLLQGLPHSRKLHRAPLHQEDSLLMV